jgi:hypothetical protein
MDFKDTARKISNPYAKKSKNPKAISGDAMI